MDTIGFEFSTIDPSAFIAPTATVIGHVELGAEVSVWFGAVIRGDAERITVGPGSNVQDHAVLHADPGYPCLIGPDVTIGHSAVVHGCIVEEGALIGIHATILNGAMVGAGAIVGAGAVVPEGMVIPAGTLAVGIPARIVRELDESGRKAGATGAANYRERARLYRAYFSTYPSL